MRTKINIIIILIGCFAISSCRNNLANFVQSEQRSCKYNNMLCDSVFSIQIDSAMYCNSGINKESKVKVKLQNLTDDTITVPLHIMDFPYVHFFFLNDSLIKIEDNPGFYRRVRANPPIVYDTLRPKDSISFYITCNYADSLIKKAFVNDSCTLQLVYYWGIEINDCWYHLDSNNRLVNNHNDSLTKPFLSNKIVFRK